MYAGDDERPATMSDWRCKRCERRDGVNSQLWADLEDGKKAEKSRKRQKERKIMEEKLIIAVSGFLELYYTSL